MEGVQFGFLFGVSGPCLASIEESTYDTCLVDFKSRRKGEIVVLSDSLIQLRHHCCSLAYSSIDFWV